ncbi:hypothetical protein GCM10007866_10000 [Gluconobacter albidus]|uniref:Transposase n=1 Tax=Gluconobacter albidus TaxID=318683 RepID=A0ABQ5X106_9PROT|nr:hypothetical protein GCM10007866_10000 [Gluconobacter albidus]
MRKRSTQPIQLPDNECVTTLYIREAFFKTGSVIACSRGLVLEDVSLIDARLHQSIALQIH